MKKYKFYRILGLLTVFILLTGCQKEEVEPITIPDTIVENETETTPTPSEESPQEEITSSTETVETTAPPVEEPEETYTFWDQIYDYSQDQPALTST